MNCMNRKNEESLIKANHKNKQAKILEQLSLISRCAFSYAFSLFCF